MLRSTGTLLAATVLAGCMTVQSELGVVRPNAETLGTKLLRSGARTRICRSSLFGIPLEPTASASLVADLLKMDAEADILSHVHVTTESISTGVYNRTCVELIGDVGREVSVVRLPVVGEHQHHHE